MFSFTAENEKHTHKFTQRKKREMCVEETFIKFIKCFYPKWSKAVSVHRFDNL